MLSHVRLTHKLNDLVHNTDQTSSFLRLLEFYCIQINITSYFAFVRPEQFFLSKACVPVITRLPLPLLRPKPNSITATILSKGLYLSSFQSGVGELSEVPERVPGGALKKRAMIYIFGDRSSGRLSVV